MVMVQNENEYDSYRLKCNELFSWKLLWQPMAVMPNKQGPVSHGLSLSGKTVIWRQRNFGLGIAIPI